jgi:hypothetical protein
MISRNPWNEATAVRKGDRRSNRRSPGHPPRMREEMIPFLLAVNDVGLAGQVAAGVCLANRLCRDRFGLPGFHRSIQSHPHSFGPRLFDNMPCRNHQAPLPSGRESKAILNLLHGATAGCGQLL